jgi:hypothetical protein
MKGLLRSELLTPDVDTASLVIDSRSLQQVLKSSMSVLTLVPHPLAICLLHSDYGREPRDQVDSIAIGAVLARSSLSPKLLYASGTHTQSVPISRANSLPLPGRTRVTHLGDALYRPRERVPLQRPV